MEFKSSYLGGKLFLLVYILAVFSFQELLFRYVFPVPELKNLDRAIFWNVNPKNPKLNFQRNGTKYWGSSLDTSKKFIHDMNMYGFRDTEWLLERKEGRKRILFIGDSFVEGIMAEQDETIPVGFLKGFKVDAEVMNAGMVGQGLSVYLQLMADLIPNYKPDLAVLCVYSNDMGPDEPIVPQYYLEPQPYGQFTPRVLDVVEQLMRGNPLLTRWGGEAQPFLNAVPEKSNPWTDHEDKLRRRVTDRIAEEMIKGSFNPARTNDLFIEEHYLKQSPNLGETIPFFRHVCEQNGTEPLVVYIPSKNQVSNAYLKYEFEMCLEACNDSIDLTKPAYQLHQKIIADQCRAFGLNFIDLSNQLRAKEAANNRLFWNYDEHMRGHGYLLCGEMIFDRWERQMFE